LTGQLEYLRQHEIGSANGDTTGAINFSDAWASETEQLTEWALFQRQHMPGSALYECIDFYSNRKITILLPNLNAPAAGAPPVIAEQPQSQASYVGGAVDF